MSTHLGLGRVLERTSEATACFTVETGVSDATVGELGLAANVAHVARVDRTVALFGLLRNVAYRMALRLRLVTQQQTASTSTTAQKMIRSVCFIAKVSVYVVVRA